MSKINPITRQGISALPTILMLSSIILEIVVAGLIVSYFFNRSLLSEQLSVEAMKAAESGAHDAISRVNDYINCPDSGTYNDSAAKCPSLYKYFVVDAAEPSHDRVACVSIGAITGGKMTIYSRGTAFTRNKTIMVVLDVATTTATVEVQSSKEVETPLGVFNSCDS